MKKLLVLGLALALVLAFTLPAAALENVFGGYWRTRAYHEENFLGDDDFSDGTPFGAGDAGLTRVDTRTRLYYTAILNDNLKLVNKFEMDAVWGGGGGRFGDYGDFGADAVAIEVKQTYVDANIGPVRTKIGVHDVTWARGFIYSDEFSGIDLIFKMGDASINATWMKALEGGTNNNSDDVDIFAFWPSFAVAEVVKLTPFFIYAYSSDGTAPFSFGYNDGGLGLAGAPGVIPALNDDGVGIYWVGADVDFTVGPASIWLTGVYQGGKAKSTITDDLDVKAYLVAGGASVPVGPAELHGQAFYASGDGDYTDNDLEAFFGIGGLGVGWAYYWSEIMGLGTFDAQSSFGSPNADVSNIIAANIGASISPVEKLKLTGDLWYATLAEDSIITDEKKLGWEIDVKADYQLAEGLNMTVVGAYLFADDASSITADAQDDAYEIGTQLSLSF